MVTDGLGAIALIVIAAFGIDRIVTGVLFLLSFIKPWNRFSPDPTTIQDTLQRAEAERKRKLIYFTLAGILGGGVLAYFGEVRIFRALGFVKTDPILDSIMTGLILMGGADRIAVMLKLMPGDGTNAQTTQSRPIEITGRLILEDEQGSPIGKKQSSQ